MARRYSYFVMQDVEGKMQSCGVHIFDCSKQEDKEMLNYLRTLAATQKQHFSTIFPWETQCDSKDTLMFVSLQYSYDAVQTRSLSSLQDSQTIMQYRPIKICGWMTMYAITAYRQKYLYVSTLSSRTPLDPSYKGVGAALLRAVEQYATVKMYDFIYLLPLSDVVGFYKKQGYIQVHPRVPYFTKPIHGMPSRHLISSMVKKMDEKAMQSSEEHELQKISQDMSAIEREKLWILIEQFPLRLYEVLAIYQENESIEDVRQWIKLYLP
jgi:hypothetical protein